jgi:hypothetical protein
LIGGSDGGASEPPKGFGGQTRKSESYDAYDAMAMRPSFDEKAAKRWNLAMPYSAVATFAATPDAGDITEFTMNDRNSRGSRVYSREESEYFLS